MSRPRENKASCTQQGIDDVSDDVAIAAVDTVLKRYPSARWTTDGKYGRLVQFDGTPVSLNIPLIDPSAENLAWLETAKRLTKYC